MELEDSLEDLESLAIARAGSRLFAHNLVFLGGLFKQVLRG